jgi:hypothetical protein
MKEKLIILFLLLSPVIASAQFTKGQVFLGGSLSLGLDYQHYTVSPTQNTTQGKNNSFTISMTGGYFLNQKVAVGINIGYSKLFSESDWTTGFQNSKANSFTTGLFTRYYIPLSKSFYFAVQGKIYFDRENGANTALNNGTMSVDQISDSYSLGLTVNPIFIFFPSSKWSIEGSVGSLGYDYTRSLPNVSSGYGFGLSAGSLAFGLAYYFSRKE